MAVAYVASSASGASGGTGTTPTLSDYVIASSGANTMLVVLFHKSNLAPAVASVTWNTTESLTQIGLKKASSDHEVQAWYLLNPTATTANIVVTMDSGAGYGTYIVACLLTGVSSSTPTGDGNSANGSANASSLAIANCTADDMAIAVGGAENTSGTYSATTGTLLIAGHGAGYADTGTGYNTGTGSVTVAFSHGSGVYAIYGFRAIAAAASSAVNVVMNIL